MIIQTQEAKLIAKFLEKASEEFSNHGCNDFDLTEILPDVTDRRALAKAMEEFNNSPDDFDPEDDYRTLPDWWLMSYFAARLEGRAK